MFWLQGGFGGFIDFIASTGCRNELEKNGKHIKKVEELGGTEKKTDRE